MRYNESWAPILSGDYEFDARIIVTDESLAEPVPTTYTQISAPVISRTLNNDCLGLGGVNSATLDVSILTTDVIPKGAKIEVQGRVINASTEGDWMPFGTFWVDSRETEGELTTLHCYDALLRANYLFNYTAEEILQPKQMADVVEDVASRIGVQIDSRTVILQDEDLQAEVLKYAMTPPTDMQMSEALKYIGQINGGNWIMTEGNELRLVPLFNSNDDETEEQDSEQVIADAVVGQYRTGAVQVVSRVAFEDNQGNVYGYGSNSEGFNIICQNPYSIDEYASNLFGRFRGKNYYPYSASSVVINPLFELGDTLEINGLVSQIVNARIKLDVAFRAELTAPEGSQQSEYPYQSRFIQLVNEVKRVVEGQIVEINNNLDGDAEGSVNERILAQINATLDTISARYVTQDGLKSYIDFTANGIRLGSTESPIKLMLSNQSGNEGLFFYTGDDDNANKEDAIAYFSDNQLYVNQVVAISSLRVGNNESSYYWKVEGDGSLSLIYERRTN